MKISLLALWRESEFIKRAENKFVFASFCLTMRELHKNSQYLVKLPVFLDATCSGIQHLASLIQDVELASKVNLIVKSPKLGIKIGPADIYNELRKPINEEIRQTGRENPAYINLAELDLDRKTVKTPIMTRTYNVTRTGIREQLMSKFKKQKDKYVL